MEESRVESIQMQYTVGVGTSSRCDGGGACSCASGCDASVSSSVVTIGGAWGDPNGVGVGLAWKTLSPSLSYRLKPLFCPSNSASSSGKGEFPASGEQGCKGKSLSSVQTQNNDPISVTYSLL